MRFPLVTRKKYDTDIAELKARVMDLERHFVTAYDSQGKVAETLADVPYDKRGELKKRKPQARPTWQQRRAWLEETDGGRRK